MFWSQHFEPLLHIKNHYISCTSRRLCTSSQNLTYDGRKVQSYIIMPHATVYGRDSYQQTKHHRESSPKSIPRDLHHLSLSLASLQVLYDQSQLSHNMGRHLQASFRNSPTPITKILSLGLGSLQVTKGRSRRLKQLTILPAIYEDLKDFSGRDIEMYAQDPTFTRTDEAFLTSLGIRILHTSSGSSLGEAASIISPSTMIYSPFLTLEVYEELLVKSRLPVPVIFGDDFNALLGKWPKYSEQRKQVEMVMRMGMVGYRRREVSGGGFWEDEDETFPMAVYERADGNGKGTLRVRAKI